MQKRRQNRIQGGWASSRVASQKTVRNPSENDKKTQSTNTDSSSSTTSSVHSSFSFVFQDDAAKKVKRNLPEMVIAKGGIYEISDTPNGISRLEFYSDFILPDDAKWMFDQLINDIPWEEKYIKLKDGFHKQPRLTAWFGDFSYTYSGLTLHPFQWSPLLEILRDKIREKTGQTFNSMLANLYRDNKDSVDWHADDEVSLGECPTIASVSFGDTRNFELKRKLREDDDSETESPEKVKIPLSSGSLLIMKDSLQKDWQHRVPKEYHDRGPRINLTFRNIKPAS